MVISTDRIAELDGLLNTDAKAEWVRNLWNRYNSQRAEKVEQWSEIDKYIFATDTTTTSNQSLDWTHTTTTPKITQIRDNLHANYLSSLFPNDKWLTWNAYTQDAAKKSVAKTITGYMENKTREGGFRETVSRLLYDYIDKGNAFATPSFETRYMVRDDEKVTSFIGPKLVRVSPYDIVFNPTAKDFQSTFKVIRHMTTVGALRKLVETHPDQTYWADVLERREVAYNAAMAFSADDWAKHEQYSVDGFGTLHEYYLSDSVEILEFYGDYHDANTGELKTNRMITIVDRAVVARDIETPEYDGVPAIFHVGWRVRPDNLWSMGPLDNLVGMQYMIDHYINMGANALDLKVMPPKKIIGDVEQFDWIPNGEIHIDEGGDVQEMAQNFNDVYTALEFVRQLEDRMELYAGAPREAMGIRTPGEKTAFEVQALENAAGRIFQEKIVHFELFMERCLNSMLEVAHRNFPLLDTIRIVDNDLGVQEFRDIRKEDITANGILRPVGARHFAQRAQELQNLVGVFNSPIAQYVAPHTSGVGLSEFVSDVVDLRGYKIFQKNIAIAEQQEIQALSTQAEEDNIMASQVSEEQLLAEAEATGELE